MARILMRGIVTVERFEIAGLSVQIPCPQKGLLDGAVVLKPVFIVAFQRGRMHLMGLPVWALIHLARSGSCVGLDNSPDRELAFKKPESCLNRAKKVEL